MGGGLMQQVNYGAWDIYLTGTHKLYFKVVCRRHTNFLQWKLLSKRLMDKLIKVARRHCHDFMRNGDLVGRLWLDCLLDRDTLTECHSNTLIGQIIQLMALVKECEIADRWSKN